MIKQVKKNLKKNKFIYNLYIDLVYEKHFVLYKLCPILTIKSRYKQSFNKELNLINPQTLNEKINYINIYKRHKDATKCADKYEVRQYIKECGYEHLLVNLLGVYDNAKEIDFNLLPNKFALKATHGSGYNIICKDKENLDIKETNKQLNRWLKENFAIKTLEFHYKDIKPRIICEEYIDGFDGKLPIDYKVFCFNGDPKFIECCVGRDEDLNMIFYDLEWNKLDASTSNNSNNLNIDKPKTLNKMIEVAKDLSTPFDFVRVDFFDMDGKLIFGELTFTPANGKMKSMTSEYDLLWGRMLDLNIENKEEYVS